MGQMAEMEAGDWLRLPQQFPWAHTKLSPRCDVVTRAPLWVFCLFVLSMDYATTCLSSDSRSKGSRQAGPFFATLFSKGYQHPEPLWIWREGLDVRDAEHKE